MHLFFVGIVPALLLKSIDKNVSSRQKSVPFTSNTTLSEVSISHKRIYGSLDSTAIVLGPINVILTSPFPESLT